MSCDTVGGVLDKQIKGTSVVIVVSYDCQRLGFFQILGITQIFLDLNGCCFQMFADFASAVERKQAQTEKIKIFTTLLILC